jgi:hypothetical protein
MRVRATLTAIAAVVALGFLAESAMAETISIKGHAQKDVKGDCGGSGDVYFSPSKYGVYGCMHGDGSGIVCGGTGKDKKTCDTFKTAPPHLPTRVEIHKADKAIVK